MLGLIALVAIVVWLGTAFGETVGVIAVAVAVLLLIIAFCSGWSKDTKAYYNRTSYWAMSGKDRAMARRRWNAEAKAYDERERREAYERAEAKRKREAYIARKRAERFGTASQGQPLAQSAGQQRSAACPSAQERTYMQKEKLFVCPKCCRYVRVIGSRALECGRVVTEYYCPQCRERRTTGI